MKYFEFGQEHPELMVMLHGGGVCYRGALPVAEEMAKTYHLVLVAYDGFNPDEPETQFRSVPDEARRLGDYIVERYGGKIDILYGVSYGTFVLMDVLADKRLTITTTIANGMPTMDYADIKSPVLQNLYIFFLTGFSYWLIGKAGPIRKKLVCKMMGRTEESFDRIVYKDATWQSWVNQDKYMIGRRWRCRPRNRCGPWGSGSGPAPGPPGRWRHSGPQTGGGAGPRPPGDRPCHNGF